MQDRPLLVNEIKTFYHPIVAEDIYALNGDIAPIGSENLMSALLSKINNFQSLGGGTFYLDVARCQQDIIFFDQKSYIIMTFDVPEYLKYIVELYRLKDDANVFTLGTTLKASELFKQKKERFLGYWHCQKEGDQILQKFYSCNDQLKWLYKKEHADLEYQTQKKLAEQIEYSEFKHTLGYIFSTALIYASNFEDYGFLYYLLQFGGTLGALYEARQVYQCEIENDAISKKRDSAAVKSALYAGKCRLFSHQPLLTSNVNMASTQSSSVKKNQSPL